MTNKRFFTVMMILLLLFSLSIGNMGCGSSSRGAIPSGNDNNNAVYYVVSFDSNGGSEVASVKVTSGSTIEAPTAPTKEGYTFAGWYKDNNTFQNIFTFGTGGEKITADITLYAQWIENDALVAEYALSEIVIGYGTGDNPNYVTQNLTLPTKIGSADISWASNSGAVASDGTVTRQDADTDVTLTATASYNGKSASRIFNVKVIKKRTRVNSEIVPITLNPLIPNNTPLKFTLISGDNNASVSVRDIEGNYVSFDIQNADDALDAVTVIKNELGVKNPEKELEVAVVTSDSSGAEYQFQQVHNGVKVFGRTIMTSANSSGKGDFLHSNLLSSDSVAKVEGKADIGQSTAENNAKAAYGGSVTVDTANTEKVIYSLGDYEADPVYAYLVNVSGTLSNNTYIDENVLVNATTGAIVDNFSNIHEDSVNLVEVNGYDELGNPVSFDVYLIELDNNNAAYVMTGNYPRVQMYLRDLDTPIIHNVGEAWNDGQAISAYINMCEVINWWKESFDRNSLDGKGMTVKVVAHAGEKNNAAWMPLKEAIYIYDMGYMERTYYSYASVPDTLTHESTHAVLQYEIPGEFPYKNITGAIDEGYADIFGCIKIENWQLGEKHHKSTSFYRYDRNITDPYDDNAYGTSTRVYGGQHAPRTISEHLPYTTDPDYDEENGDKGGVHRNSFLVSRPAYLMHEDYAGKNVGLTWDEIGKVWYKSISMGFNAESTFEDVRRCVLWAAQKQSLSDSKIAAIKAAFDEVGITAATKGSLRGTVTEYGTEDSFLSGVKVTVFDTAVSGGSVLPSILTEKTTSLSGRYVIDLETGRYNVIVAKDGYVSLSAFPTIYESEDVKMDVKLVKPGAGSVSGTILSSPDKSPIEGVTLNIRSGWFVQDATVKATTTTDTSGQYSFELGDNGAGYYTIEMIKDGYTTSTFNVTVSGMTTGQNGYIEKKDNQSAPVVADVPIDEAHFPDEIFRSYVLSNFDTDNNGILSSEEVGKVTEINVYSRNISSLQGIEHFISLLHLDCSINQLTELDVSKNTALKRLCCEHNKLTFLDIGKNTSLLYLDCDDNQLTELNVSKNTALNTLFCSINKLTALDLSKNTTLRNLGCFSNQLTTLDVSKNFSLVLFSCQNNQLTTLDVSGCSALEDINCSSNQLITLDVTKNTTLKALYCDFNQLNALSVGHKTALQRLDCRYNQLTALDLSNCPNLDNNNVTCDDGVNIIWPSAPSISNAGTAMTANAPNEIIILASIPTFTAERTGEYSFDVSLDKTVSAGSTLIFKNSSENLSGVFLDENGEEITMPTTTSLDRVKVSANFVAGSSYTPVVAANLNNGSSAGGQGGGCVSVGNEELGLRSLFILLMCAFGVLLRRKGK